MCRATLHAMRFGDIMLCRWSVVSLVQVSSDFHFLNGPTLREWIRVLN